MVNAIYRSRDLLADDITRILQQSKVNQFVQSIITRRISDPDWSEEEGHPIVTIQKLFWYLKERQHLSRQEVLPQPELQDKPYRIKKSFQSVAMINARTLIKLAALNSIVLPRLLRYVKIKARDELHTVAIVKKNDLFEMLEKDARI